MNNYWFSNLTTKVKNYISNCLNYITFSPITGRKEGFSNPIPKDNVPFSTFYIDHYRPVYKKLSAKQHVLLVIDGFTKFVKLYPVKTTDSKEAINTLKDHLRNYSRPKTIV